MGGKIKQAAEEIHSFLSLKFRQLKIEHEIFEPS